MSGSYSSAERSDVSDSSSSGGRGRRGRQGGAGKAARGGGASSSDASSSGSVSSPPDPPPSKRSMARQARREASASAAKSAAGKGKPSSKKNSGDGGGSSDSSGSHEESNKSKSKTKTKAKNKKKKRRRKKKGKAKAKAKAKAKRRNASSASGSSSSGAGPPEVAAHPLNTEEIEDLFMRPGRVGSFAENSIDSIAQARGLGIQQKRKYLLATGMDDNSMRALHYLLRIISQRDTLMLLLVLPEKYLRNGPKKAEATEYLEALQVVVEQAKPGAQTSGHVKFGSPKKVICRAAGSLNADVVVMGARKMGTMKRFVAGSVSTYVTGKAPCSVLVVKDYDYETADPLEPLSYIACVDVSNHSNAAFNTVVRDFARPGDIVSALSIHRTKGMSDSKIARNEALIRGRLKTYRGIANGYKLVFHPLYVETNDKPQEAICDVVASADTSMLALGHRGTLRNSVGMYCVHNAEVNAVLIVREKEILVSQFTTHDAERVNEVRRLKIQEINREFLRSGSGFNESSGGYSGSGSGSGKEGKSKAKKKKKKKRRRRKKKGKGKGSGRRKGKGKGKGKAKARSDSSSTYESWSTDTPSSSLDFGSTSYSDNLVSSRAMAKGKSNGKGKGKGKGKTKGKGKGKGKAHDSSSTSSSLAVYSDEMLARPRIDDGSGSHSALLTASDSSNKGFDLSFAGAKSGRRRGVAFSASTYDVKGRDYTLVIDASEAMDVDDMDGGDTRWEAVEFTAHDLAKEASKIGSGDLRVYMVDRGFLRFDNVTSRTVGQLFDSVAPTGPCVMAPLLQRVFADYVRRRDEQKQKHGETVVVLTAGIFEDPDDVRDALIEISNHVRNDKEFVVTFIQAGSDEDGAALLTELDDDLKAAGAAYDIVDTKNVDWVNVNGLEETFQQALTD